jgi:UDP-N-acetylglucosamine 2-epimerase (non-hydrolysing)
MSGVLLRDLDIPAPDVHLRVGSGSHAVQTARVMTRLERLLQKQRPDRLLVVGDVNSTVAAALVGAKMGIPVDHVEAGLRSGDRGMPEEINRLVTDSLADLLFVSEPAGLDNLQREGKQASQLHLVGNVMIDTLERCLPRAREVAAWRAYGFAPKGYGIVTLHRPSNVDDPQRLEPLRQALADVTARLPLLFPVHPRSRPSVGRWAETPGLKLCDPLGYLEFVSLLSQARVVITDSGGIQEETTALGVPCLTVRANTERPITVSEGTNTLIGSDPGGVPAAVSQVLEGTYKQSTRPALWDGHAATRIARVLADL